MKNTKRKFYEVPAVSFLNTCEEDVMLASTESYDDDAAEVYGISWEDRSKTR